nr:diguanylate cyclase [Zoogloeaceae bacterium]
MSAPTQPSDIAREVLRLFAARRLPPTPANFRALYHEVSETADEEDGYPERLIREIASRLPYDTSERKRAGKQIERALANNDRSGAEEALFTYLGTISQEAPPAWNALIANLLRHWELRQLGWTVARKRESLERVLAANDPATLHNRLQGLVRAWSQSPTDPESQLPADGTETSPAAGGLAAVAQARPELTLVAPGEAGELIARLRELVLLALETVVPPFLSEHPDLVRDANALAASVRASSKPAQLQVIAQQMRKFAYRLEMVAADTGEIRAGLIKLLRLLLENIEEIVIDDQWLHGQVEVLREIVAKPASLRLIDDAERRLKEVIFKQSQLKHNLAQAQQSLREMLAGFVDQLANFSAITGSYHDKIAASAQQIASARDINEISAVLDEVMRETRGIQDEARRSRDELNAATERARKAEARIAELQHELDEASRLMRHDQLTGALNRRGLEETFEKESARALRRDVSLCIALLDIDNFKRLNDTYGHQTGDEALIHLVKIIQENLRPNDIVARLGGEEFIIIYPESDLEQATAALVRLQRELTKAYFMADDKKLLITFSAGVSVWSPGESMEAVIGRADGAMYQAKQTGKNKVVAIEAPAP